MFGTYERLRVSVFASEIAVVKAARRKLAPHATRAQRHAFYRQMLQHHANARRLYADIIMDNI